MHTKRTALSTKASHTPDLSCSDPVQTEPAHTRGDGAWAAGPQPRVGPRLCLALHRIHGANVPIRHAPTSSLLSGGLSRRPLLPEEGRHKRRRRQLDCERALDGGRGRAIPPRSKQASSAFGQMALRSLIHQDPTSGQRETMPGAAPSFGPPRPISRLGRLGRGEAGGPCSHRYRQSIPPPATSRHLLAGTQQLVTHLVGVRVVRVRVRVRVGVRSRLGLGPRLG